MDKSLPIDANLRVIRHLNAWARLVYEPRIMKSRHETSEFRRRKAEKGAILLHEGNYEQWSTEMLWVLDGHHAGMGEYLSTMKSSCEQHEDCTYLEEDEQLDTRVVNILLGYVDPGFSDRWGLIYRPITASALSGMLSERCSSPFIIMDLPKELRLQIFGEVLLQRQKPVCVWETRLDDPGRRIEAAHLRLSLGLLQSFPPDPV